MRLKPQRSGRDARVAACHLPPCDFIAVTVNGAMVPSTERDDKLVADLATKGLGFAQSAGDARPTATATNQTGLGRPISDMAAIADTALLC